MSATERSLICFLILGVLGLIIYSIVPKRKWIVLLVFSYTLIFYLSNAWLLIQLLITLIIFICGLNISKQNKLFNEKKVSLEKDERKKLKANIKKKQKLTCIIGVSLCVIILALLKYLNLPIYKINNIFNKYSLFYIAFPILGISYYMLMAIGYLMDVYRGKYEAETNFFKLSLFISFFPTQIEGPIGRYDVTGPQLFKNTNPTITDLSEGVLYILGGLFKKIVIADRINIIVSEIFKNYSSYSGSVIVIAMICYAIQLYTDFSGYINIAEGISRLFGIKLEINFNRPFLSRSVGEFWRRWHISLGGWLRDYIFYPIALSKPYMAINKKIHGKVKPFVEKIIITSIPMFFVWLACGVWHGAGFKYIVYGMYYFVIILLEMIFEPLTNKIKKDKWYINILFIFKTLVIVTIGLTMFRAESLKDFGLMIGRIFSNESCEGIRHIINTGDLICLIVSVIGLFIYEILKEFNIDLHKKIINGNIVVRYSICMILLAIVVIFGAYGANYAAVDPMYALY